MVELFIVAALILCNGFFAMSEMALMTSRKLRLRQMSETSAGAKVALELSENPDNLLSTVQVGITAIGVLTGLFGGDALGAWLSSWLGSTFPVAVRYAHPIGITTAVVVITAANVIFGELIPKRLALTNPESIASAVARPLQILSNAAKPVVGILGTINRLFLRLFGIRDDRVQAISEEEIRLLVTESHEQGVIDADERKMMNRVLSLGDRTTDSVMTPRNRIVWLDREAAYEENLQIMRERPYSRYPVLRDGSDNDIAGILETKMLPSSTESAGTERLFSTLREPLYVAESTNIVRLLEIFREEHQSVAIVVDEYGDVAGLVTINDILGAIVGRIEDVTESESQPHVVQRQDGSYLLDGKLGIEEFKELLRTSSLPQEDDHDFVTAAGFLIANLGRIPHVGELFSWGRWQLEVVDLDGPRVDKLLLTHKAPPEDEAA